jgi:hypothetical protein
MAKKKQIFPHYLQYDRFEIIFHHIIYCFYEIKYNNPSQLSTTGNKIVGKIKWRKKALRSATF